jgi:hypothetical protein
MPPSSPHVAEEYRNVNCERRVSRMPYLRYIWIPASAGMTEVDRWFCYKPLICSAVVDGQDIRPERVIFKELLCKRGISGAQGMTGINVQMRG